MNEFLVQLFQNNVNNRITPELANGMISVINQQHQAMLNQYLENVEPKCLEMSDVA